MSPRLPVVSGEDFIQVLKKFGDVIARQKGSHVRLRHTTDPQRKPLTVPLHKTLKRGLLHRLLRDAQISEQQLANSL